MRFLWVLGVQMTCRCPAGYDTDDILTAFIRLLTILTIGVLLTLSLIKMMLLIIVFMFSFRCPLKKQNYDYAMYLLTALYYESWVSWCLN